jgi:hypothetical protein
MATAIATTEDKQIAVKSVTSVYPHQILAEEAENWSRYLKVTDDDPFTRRLAYDMSINGNRTPVKVRRINLKDTPLKLTAGFHRHRAGMLIHKGFDHVNPETEEIVRVYNPEFKLQVQLMTGKNDEDLFEENISENADRKMLTHMDYANIAKVARTIWGWDNKKIAAKLQAMKGDAKSVSDTYVSQLIKLLELPNRMKDALAHGLISPSIKVLTILTDITVPEMREKFFDDLLEGNKVTKEDITEAIRAYNAKHDPDAAATAAAVDGEGDPEGDAAPATPVAPRSSVPTLQMSLKEQRKFWEEQTNPGTFGPVRTFARYILENWLKGKSDNKRCEKELELMCLASIKIAAQHMIDTGMTPEEVLADKKFFGKLPKDNTPVKAVAAPKNKALPAPAK